MKLYDFQEEGRSFIEKHKYVLLGDEMGLGKTIQALAALRGKTGPALIVCPAFLRKTWSNEIDKILVAWKDFDLEPVIVTQVGDFDKPMFDEDSVYIISYEMLKKIPETFYPEHIIFDEAHYLKNMKATRTALAHSLIAKTLPETLILLSGTPIKNRVPEFYSILRLLSYCPSKTNGIRIPEKSQYAFNIKFTNPTTRTIMVKHTAREITEFHGVRNTELLKKYLQKKYIRRLAKSVLELPPLITKEVQFGERLARDKDYIKAYQEYEETGVLTTLKMELAISKVKYTCSYACDLLEQGEPLVIFSDHIQPVEDIASYLKGKGYKVGAITGKTPTSKRDDVVVSFQNGDLNVLVATIGSASVGYTLTRARNLIFNDYSWVPSDMEQARKRIHRIGQTNHSVIHMVLGSKVDTYILKTIEGKMRTMKKVL